MEFNIIEIHKQDKIIKGWINSFNGKVTVLLEYPGTKTGVIVILDPEYFNPYPSEMFDVRCVEYTNDFFCLLGEGK